MTRSWGRKPDRQGGSGFQGFRKAAPGAHLKDDICLSDACFNRLLHNFCDTGRRPSPAAAAKSLQSCPTLCDPIPGILQARTLEWFAISFFNAWKWKLKVKLLSHVRLFVTPWTAAYQAPLSMGFSRQEYWSGVPLPSPAFPYLFPNKIRFRTLINKFPRWWYFMRLSSVKGVF